MKITLVVYTTDGKEWESTLQDASPKDLEAFTELFKTFKDLNHFYMPTVDALGRKTKVYFHPEKIVAVRVTEEILQ